MYNKPFRGAILNRTHPFVKGLNACWLFNEFVGPRVYDLVNGNLGSFVSTVSWDGNDLRFTGGGTTGGYINVPHSPTVDPFGEFSLEVIFNTTLASTQQCLLEKYNWATGYGNYFFRIISTNKLRTGVINGTSSSSLEQDGTINTNQWYHAIGTFNTYMNRLRIYIDGILNIEGLTATVNPPTSSVSLKIGARGNDALDRFVGRMKLARIWSRELTASEVMQIYLDPYCMFKQPSRAKYFFVTGEAAFKPYWIKPTEVIHA